MRIKTVELSGYRSICPDRPVSCGDLGHLNIFIGPNNCGKSSVFRFLQVVANQISDNEFEMCREVEKAKPDWWWSGDVSDSPTHDISALIVLDGTGGVELEPKAEGDLCRGSEWRVTVAIKRIASERCWLIIAPQVYIAGNWLDLIVLDRELNAPTHLNRLGRYVSTQAGDACPFHERGKALLLEWARITRFFDPVRALDRTAGRRNMIDGSVLLGSLCEMERGNTNVPDFEMFHDRLLALLNELLFVPVGMSPISKISIKGEHPDRLDMWLKPQEGPSVCLEHMGTGISELVILLAEVLRSGGGTQFFLEEPETHLHPGLIRRLMRELGRRKDIQFFLSSHSNVILDSLSTDDRVYSFSRSSGGGTVVSSCDALTEMHQVLDDLGVSGSTILQANCIVWVEGPSDRVYLQTWIELICPSLLERSDYAFAYYGGRVLSHFAFEGGVGLISLIRLNRFSVVFMDRDVDASASHDAIRETKRRVEEDAANDPNHRLALYTKGREIENDLPSGVISKVLMDLWPKYGQAWARFEPSGDAPFAKEAAKLAEPTVEARRKLAKRIAGAKVEIARRAVLHVAKADEVPPYVKALTDFIISSRTLS